MRFRSTITLVLLLSCISSSARVAYGEKTARIRKLVTNRLTEQLSSGSPAVRKGAARTLSENKSPSAVKALGRALATDKNLQVRIAAARALGMLGNWAALKPLLSALESDRVADVRATAVEALVRYLRHASVVRALSLALQNDPSEEVKVAVAKLLSGARNRVAVVALQKTLQDKSPNVRIAVARALAKRRGTRSIRDSLAVALSSEENREAAQAIALALVGVGGQTLIISRLDSKSSQARWIAAWALGKARPGLAATTKLAALVEDDDVRLRSVAVWAIGRARGRVSRRSVLALQQVLLKDHDDEVREAAALAIGELGRRAVFAVRALKQALVKDPDQRVRSAAAWALGKVGSRAAKSALQRGLGDASPRVRHEAGAALRALRERRS